MSGIPRQASFSPRVPASSWGVVRGESGGEVSTSFEGVRFALRRDFGSFPGGTMPSPKKDSKSLPPKDSLELAKVWEDSGKTGIHQPGERKRVSRQAGRLGEYPGGQRAVLARARLLRYAPWYQGSSPEPQFPSGLVQALFLPLFGVGQSLEFINNRVISRKGPAPSQFPVTMYSHPHTPTSPGFCPLVPTPAPSLIHPPTHTTHTHTHQGFVFCQEPCVNPAISLAATTAKPAYQSWYL